MPYTVHVDRVLDTVLRCGVLYVCRGARLQCHRACMDDPGRRRARVCSTLTHRAGPNRHSRSIRLSIKSRETQEPLELGSYVLQYLLTLLCSNWADKLPHSGTQHTHTSKTHTHTLTSKHTHTHTHLPVICISPCSQQRTVRPFISIKSKKKRSLTYIRKNTVNQFNNKYM